MSACTRQLSLETISLHRSSDEGMKGASACLFLPLSSVVVAFNYADNRSTARTQRGDYLSHNWVSRAGCGLSSERKWVVHSSPAPLHPKFRFLCRCTHFIGEQRGKDSKGWLAGGG